MRPGEIIILLFFLQAFVLRFLVDKSEHNTTKWIVLLITMIVGLIGLGAL